MILAVYAIIWVSVCAAAALAVYMTGSAMPLWAILIPALIEFRHKSK
jgi:hypothetical protein